MKEATVHALLYLGLLLATAATAAEPSYPYDPGLAEYEKKAQAIRQDCDKQFKNVVKQMNCSDAQIRQLDKSNPRRGAGYAIAHYSKMSLEQLEARWMELRPQRWVARSRREFNSANPKPLGEVTKEDIEAEMDFIERQRFTRSGTYFDPELKLSPEELKARQGDGAYIRKKNDEARNVDRSKQAPTKK